MEREVKKLLFDISVSVKNINEFLGEKKYYEEYKKNTLVRRAIERELEIIGEAIHRLLKINPDIEITTARKIVNFRNRISHGYDSVDDETVWGIIINHLPLLQKEVESLLKDDK
jgi:uncharacterized protein with HEPN domain